MSSKNPRSSRERDQQGLQLCAEAVRNIEASAFVMLSPEGEILTWNLGAQRIFKHRPEEVVGRNFSLLYSPEEVANRTAQRELESAAKEGRLEVRGWRVRNSGEPFWASVVITRLNSPDGGLLGFSKTVQDSPEVRKSDDKLQASEERFRHLVSSVRDYAIFLLDRSGYVSSWNEGAARLKGYQPEEIIGKHFSVFYPEDMDREGTCAYELEEASATGRFEDEGWRLRKDGTRFWANVVITVLRDPSGQVVGFSKVTRDLTERKRGEDRLRRSNEQLESRVAQRTAELTQAKEDLEHALAARDEFLSIASHELKTPITSLKLQVQMLRRRLQPEKEVVPPAAKLAEALDIIMRQTERLNSLADDLLDVTRARTGRLTYNFAQTDLSHLVQETMKRWEEPLRSAECALNLQVAPNVAANVDPFRIEQVLSNLVSNAIKYAPGAPIEVSVRPVGKWAEISVRDTGPGIPPEKCHRIFERFERGVSSEDISGLGLGLYIAKIIVEAHHGTISVHSELGRQTVFTVCLPRV